MCAARLAKPTTDARSKDQVILNNKQVSDAALRWIEIQIRGGTTTSDPDMTVGDATRAYIAVRDPRRSSQAGRAIHLDAHSKLNRYVLEDKVARAEGTNPARARPEETVLLGWPT
jgi:hypothetical protein